LSNAVNAIYENHYKVNHYKANKKYFFYIFLNCVSFKKEKRFCSHLFIKLNLKKFEVKFKFKEI